VREANNDNLEDLHNEDEANDLVSFVGTGVELHKGASIRQNLETLDSPLSEPERDHDWESQFSQGVRESETMLACDETSVGSWVRDVGRSATVVPEKMLLAEELFLEAFNTMPEGKRKEKQAEQALQIYNHAKWLAERNYATAAEWRYRESARIAKQCRRSTLASHALARLGYFLTQWCRYDEAHVALEESMKLNTKKNPLGPYLFGVLDRQRAGSDVARLRAAEELILNSAEQPSEDLENQRRQHIADIMYWRNAELEPARCFETSSVTHLVICFACTFGRVVQEVFL
jgi:tetratricopeptide (TPR) repeat protein